MDVLQRYAIMLTPSDGARIAPFYYLFNGKFFAICVSRRSSVTKQRARCATEMTIRAERVAPSRGPRLNEALTHHFYQSFLELK